MKDTQRSGNTITDFVNLDEDISAYWIVNLVLLVWLRHIAPLARGEEQGLVVKWRSLDGQVEWRSLDGQGVGGGR